MPTKPESCIGCPYYDLPGPVKGVGPETATLAIIGQNPWKDELEVGIPFAGASGRVLNRGCYKAGVTRERAWVDNVVKCAVPPGQPLHPLAVKKCRPFLEESLAKLPLLGGILTLGAPAFEAMVPGKHFHIMHNPSVKDEWNAWLRGCPIEVSVNGRFIPLVGTMHPSYLIRTLYRETVLFQSDIAKAKRLSEEGLKPVAERFNYNPTDREVNEYVDTIIRQGYCGLDIETADKEVLEEEEIVKRATSSPINVVGLSIAEGDALGVQPDQFGLLSPLFQPRENLVDIFGFNLGFDSSHLGTYHPVEKGVRWVDVMLALNIWFSDARPKDLATAMSVFTDYPYTKNLSKKQPERYNAYDTFGALTAGINCIRELVKLGAEHVFYNHDLPLIPVVEELRVIGANCDKALADKYELQCLLALQKYEQWWEKQMPFVSWTSTQQLQAVFAKLGMPVRLKERVNKKTKERKKTPCLDEEVLAEYRDKYNNKLAGFILMMRELKHAADFTHIFDSDGRSRAQYKIHGQKQGRLQAKEPDLQNIPERIAAIEPRRIVIPDKSDHLLFNADFDQIETWVYAYAAQDQPLLEFKKTGDYLYGIFWDEWKISPKPFFIPGKPHTKEWINPEIEPADILKIKSGPLGLQYGRGVDSLTRFGFSKQRAWELRQKYFRDHKAIELHHSKRIQDAERDGYLQNLFGRIRRFSDARIMRNEILSFDGQCNGSDILKINALIPFRKSLPDFGARLVLTVHDSVLISGPEKNAEALHKHIKETMEAPIAAMNGFFIPVSIKVGESWGGVKRWEKWLAARQVVTN